MTWAMAAHYHAAPRGWALDSRLTPATSLRNGPYQLTRNPIYAGEAVGGAGARLPGATFMLACGIECP